MDEVHFQQHGSRCRMWVPSETKDPILLHHPTRKSVGYFGAIRLRDGRFFFRREKGKFNAVTCGQFLKDLRAASTRIARRVVVIADNAKYHHARLHGEWREQVAERFALDFLPPYSPELNPVEGLWDQVQDVTCNRRHESLDDLEQTLTTALRPFWETPARVLSLIHHWLRSQANATP